MDSLIFLYLLLFPFGQLLKVKFINLTDVIVLLAALLFVLKGKFKLEYFFKYFIDFLVIAIFSLIFSLNFFSIDKILIGALYFLRFVSYILFGQIVVRHFGRNSKGKKLIFNSLIVVGVTFAIFGWVQYLIFPDLTALKALNWDDHYFRLTGTFLDPAFIGILLTLTEILVMVKTIKTKNKINYFLIIFLLVTILFTYSRASYLAFLFSGAYLLIKFRQKFVGFSLLLFLVLIPLLPRPAGEGVNLTRTFSINNRFINYEEGMSLFLKSPLFGLGFDNICAAKSKFLSFKDLTSHSCSGLDNGILFILVTTGIIGMASFTRAINALVLDTEVNIYGKGLMASMIAIFVHGMFTNTFFYNFVLGWIFLLAAITRKKSLH